MWRNVFSCVSDRSTEALKQQRETWVSPKTKISNKIKFGHSLSSALKNGSLPRPLEELLVYLAREGVGTVDLFRRPGNKSESRRVVKRFSEGKAVLLTNYNNYTLASVIKRFLLKIPGGVFGAAGEERLLQTLSMDCPADQVLNIQQFFSSLTSPHQQLLALLFGTWFRIANHQHINLMSSEAIGRSVAGSMFHTCADDPAKVEKASRIIQLLIDNFAMAAMFGQHNIEYFATMTQTAIHVRERFRIDYQYPPEEVVPRSETEPWLNLLLVSEAQTLGFDLIENAITADDYEAMTQVQVHSIQDEASEMLSPPGSSYGQPLLSPKQTNMQSMGTVNTASAPEVSLLPSPEVSKRPKSLEDNLNEIKTMQQTKSLSRFNSVKRKQLERLRQRSDWFLGHSDLMDESWDDHKHEELKPKTSGNSVTKAASEGTALDVMGSDGDSLFGDDLSRSESPASEPAMHRQDDLDLLHDSTITELSDTEHSRNLTEEDMHESIISYFAVEHKYGEAES